MALVRIDAGTPRVAVAVVAVALVVGLLIVKPWAGDGAPRPNATFRAAAPTSSPTASATQPPTLGQNAVTCYSSRAWRLVTFERDGTTEQRGWYAAEPVRNATGPGDARIAHRRIATRPLTAIGFCAPATERGVPVQVRGVRVWRVDAGGRTTRMPGIEQLEDSSGESVARLYRPPPVVGTHRPWGAGTYVMAVDTTGATAWFGLRLDLVPQ